jgi:hypothetical protein
MKASNFITAVFLGAATYAFAAFVVDKPASIEAVLWAAFTATWFVASRERSLNAAAVTFGVILMLAVIAGIIEGLRQQNVPARIGLAIGAGFLQLGISGAISAYRAIRNPSTAPLSAESTAASMAEPAHCLSTTRLSRSFGGLRRLMGAFRTSWLPRLCGAAMLVFAIADHDEDYYTLLRWLVSGTAVLLGIIAAKERQFAWCWIAGMIAVLFNPLIIVELQLETWHYFDAAVAVLFIVSLAMVNEPQAQGKPGPN